jgi:hypothetical protein
MPLLRPDATIQLAGASISATGVNGQVDTVVIAPSLTAARGGASVQDGLVEHGVPDRGAAALEAALRDAQAAAVLAVPLTNLAVAPAISGTRGPQESPAVEIALHPPGEDEGQVVLEVDGSGLVAWHFAEPDQERKGVRARSAQTFRVPISQPHVPGHPAGRWGPSSGASSASASRSCCT